MVDGLLEFTVESGRQGWGGGLCLDDVVTSFSTCKRIIYGSIIGILRFCVAPGVVFHLKKQVPSGYAIGAG